MVRHEEMMVARTWASGDTRVTRAELRIRARPGPSVSHRRVATAAPFAAMILLTLIGCGEVKTLDPAEAAAAAAIESLQGSVATQLIGDDLHVVQVDLRRTSATDADLAHIAAFPKVKVIRLARTGVSNEGLRHLADLTELEELYLGRTQVNDEGLVHLEGLTSLKWLAKSHTEITDDGFARLQRSLPELKSIR